MVKFYPKFFITLGSSGNSSIYIKDGNGDWQEFINYEYFKVIKKQNQVSEFEIKIMDLEADEKLYVKEFAEVLFFSENSLILKGRIQKITYGTAYEANVQGFGMEVKLLEKELIKSGDKRVQYTNESSQTIANELLSSNTDGSSPWIITPGTNGLFSTDYGNLSIRYEYGNRLQSLAKLTSSIDYEWSVSQGDDYNDDSFNIASLLPNSTRATVSQETFEITGANANCSQTSNQKDITNLANKIDALGYGDGVNQKHTSTYNASETYSTLASDITDSSTTITLIDASSFSSSGVIRIMEETVTYAGKSGDDLTGCVRFVDDSSTATSGGNNTLTDTTQSWGTSPKEVQGKRIKITAGTGEGQIREIIDHTSTILTVNTNWETNPDSTSEYTITSGVLEHKKNVYTEKYIAISSAESGSSIGTNGLMDYTITERDVIDVETLELIASRKLLEKMNPIVRIMVIPNEPLETAGSREIGDLITINDSESDLSDDYRIVGMTYISNYGDLSLEIEVSNRSLTFIDQMQKQREANENLGKYMQGSTNIYAISEAENCDSSNYLNLRFFVPNEAIAINKVLLNFKLEDYRAYSTGVTGAPNSQTNTSMWHSSSLASISVFGSSGFASNVAYNLGFTSNFLWSNSSSFTADTNWKLPNATSSLNYYVKSSDVTPDDWSDLSVTYGVLPITTTPITSKRLLVADSFSTAQAITSFTPRSDIVKASTINEYVWGANDVYTQCKAENLSGTFDRIRASFSVQNGTGASSSPTITLSRSPDGSSWTTVQTYTPTLAAGDIFQRQVEETTDYRDYIYQLKITGMNVNNKPDISWMILNVGTYISTTNTLNYGIQEESLISPSIDLYSGEDGGSMTKKATYTTNQTEIDLTDEIKDIGAGKWVNLQFRPNKNMRIEANSYIQIFIESK